MSIESMALVLNHSRASGTTKLVLVGIANHDGDGGAWPTHATLARYANVSERNVRKAITRLVDLGEVMIDVQRGGTVDWEDHRRPNRYRVMVACPPWCDRSKQHRDTRKRHTVEPLIGGVATDPRTGEGGSLPTPVGGVATDPQTTHNKPDPIPSHSQLQTAREAPCRVCGQTEYRCQRVQVTWASDDRHAYLGATLASTAAATDEEGGGRDG